jgi:hypothetical protein
VALSVAFHPKVIDAQALPGGLPCGARTFLAEREPRATIRPIIPTGNITGRDQHRI